MGLGTRIFLVNDEGFLKRFPLAKFERLRKGEECLPQYAGQRIPYVFIVLEVQNRKPIGIYKIQYSYSHSSRSSILTYGFIKIPQF